MNLISLQNLLATDEVLVFRIQDLETGQGPSTSIKKWGPIARHVDGRVWCNEEPCDDPAIQDKYRVSGYRFGTTEYEQLRRWFGGAYRQLDAAGFGVFVFIAKKEDVCEGRAQAVFNREKAREIAWFTCRDSVKRLSAFYN